MHAKRWSQFLIGTSLACSAALGCDEDSVARRYLSSIDSMNWSQMRSYLADNAKYFDPTMTHYDRDEIALSGAEDIVQFWSSSSAESGTSDISYRVTSCLETAGYHVVNLAIDIEVSGAYWGINKDLVNIPGRLVSIIHVSENLVVQHRDYVEYSAADKVINELRASHGEAIVP
ncbi:MAG: hypothetical protein AAF194_00635 [Pseudomonadota bacterium]